MNGEQDMKKIPLKFASLMFAGLVTLLPTWASADALERIRSSNSITFGFIPDAAPFSSQEGQQVDGYSVELCRQVAGKLKTSLGLNQLEIHFQPLAQDKWLPVVASGQVDLFCTPSPASAALRKSVSFSVPVYTGGLGVVVSKEAPASLMAVLNGEVSHTGPTWRATLNRGLADHTFAVVKGGVTEAWVHDQLRLLGVIATVTTVPTYEEGVQLVAEGKAEAFFSERMLLKQYLLKLNDADKLQVLDRVFDFLPVSLAMVRGDEDLRLQVDIALSELYHSGELEQIYRKFLGAPGDLSDTLFKVYPLPLGH